MVGVAFQDFRRIGFPSLRVGPLVSDVFVLGFYDRDDTVVLVGPDRAVPNGARLG